MDAVKSFNLELSGLYEAKPPISKAKMTCITKGAIKAIKFYKHVVQSVEKFIQKCKPEYKVPGLYVIDSIVRQSRHQFGAERDVFAPRFAKNMQQTFINLFACPEEEKSKVIRVLNLWQKNHVFQPEVIQPLFDLADPNHPVYQNAIQSNGLGNQSVGALIKGSPALQKSPAKSGSQLNYSADQHPGVTNTQLHRPLQKQAGDGKGENQSVRFDKKLLDYDYDEDEDEDLHIIPSPKHPSSHNHSTSAAIDSVGSLLSNPEVLRQLQTLQQSMSQSQYQDVDIEKLRKLQEMKQQEEEFDKHLAQTVPNLPFAAECDLKPMINPPPPSMQPYYMTGIQDIPTPAYKNPAHNAFEMPSHQEARNMDLDLQGRGLILEAAEVEVINLDQTDSRSPSPNGDRYANRRRRSRSRERSRDRGRGKDRRSKRTRSRSHSRERRRQRSRSRDRDRTRDREREKDKERDKEKDREREKERRKRGLPPFKKEHLCVCSTTLWVGHLSKLVHQEELSDCFGEYGEIISIDLIPPRGCAFIAMHRRQDATRCLEKLKNHKLQGKAITIAWAPGKGLKGKELKDYWEADLGASYIPWLKVKPDIDIELLEDGGMIDEDSMPEWLKSKLTEKDIALIPSPQLPMVPAIPTLANLDTSQPPPLSGATMLQPPPLTLSMVNPFPLNLAMNLPPNMMPNVPIGVPPPNMGPASLIANQLLGFAQAPPPGLLPTPISLAASNKHPQLHKQMAHFSVLPMPPLFPEESMDVEMEDVSKSSKPGPLSDQLLASLSQNTDEPSLTSRLNAVSDNWVDENNGDNYNGRRGRSKDRDQRGEHDRYRSRESRDYRQSRSRRENRDHDRHDHRRDRSNRWNDRDHHNERNGRKELKQERSKQEGRKGLLTLREGLTELKGPPPDTKASSTDRDTISSRSTKEGTTDKDEDIHAYINPEPPADSNSLLQVVRDEKNDSSLEANNEWPSIKNNISEKKIVNEWNNSDEGESQNQNFDSNEECQFNQMNEWGDVQNERVQKDRQSNQRNEWGFERNNGHYQNDYNHDKAQQVVPLLSVRSDILLNDNRFSENNYNTENTFDMRPHDYGVGDDSMSGDAGFGGDEMPPFDQGGPMYGESDNASDQFPQFGGPNRGRGFGPDHGRHGFGGRGFRGRDNRRGFGGFDRGKRGVGFVGGPPPRLEFWPRNMRGGDGFRPRGRGGVFRGGPPGRGPRHFGPIRWNEGGDRSFQPRFDGPPDFFRGPKFDDRSRRGGFEDSRSRPPFWKDREDRRPHNRHDFNEERPPPSGKRSRWGDAVESNSENVGKEEFPDAPNVVEKEQAVGDGNYDAGNSTPLHDEPQETERESNSTQIVESEVTQTAVAVEEQQ